MATTLNLEQMKQFVRDHFEDFVNKRNAAVIRKNMTSDFHDHDGPGGKPAGVDGDEQMMLGMYKAMPDLHLTIEDMTKSCAGTSGAGLILLLERRCSFTASFSGDSRATRLPNAGLR
jgi:hypothetical protein